MTLRYRWWLSSIGFESSRGRGGRADPRADTVAKAEDPRDYKVSFDKIKNALSFSITKRVRDGIREIFDELRAGKIPEPYATRLRNT